MFSMYILLRSSPRFVVGAVGAWFYLVVTNPRYEAAMAGHSPWPVPPESRLEPCLYASLTYTVSFFWFDWTSLPSLSFWAPLAAVVPMSALLGCITLLMVPIPIGLKRCGPTLSQKSKYAPTRRF